MGKPTDNEQTELETSQNVYLDSSDTSKTFFRKFVSGRYQGHESKEFRFFVKNKFLDLRIDVDRRYPNSDILNKVSGDFFNNYQFFFRNIGKLKISTWKQYIESWIVDSPKIKKNYWYTKITGTVRFWKGTHPRTTITIIIPTWKYSKFTTKVTFESNNKKTEFICKRISDCFRDFSLELDVVESVNTEPILPTYDTDSHDNKPTGLPKRTLTLKKAYREAGICMNMLSNRTIIDDSAAEFTTWSDAELHDAMEVNFSRYNVSWPSWHMWGLLCGRYANLGVTGIMFDYWGPNEPPERQGFAVFSGHPAYDNLVLNPSTQDEFATMRDFLKLYVHEIGHAFNFRHSWDKGRENALSWMNYDWKYDNLNGQDEFWDNFMFEFDEEELIHLRHGDRSSVIMGGDDWASGPETVQPVSFSLSEGKTPVEFLIRSKGYFEYMEPIQIELRLRNLLQTQIEFDPRFEPEFGNIVINIKRPDNSVVVYQSITYKEGIPEVKVLQSHNSNSNGEDRFSDIVSLTYGKGKFYFDKPGEYLIRAAYSGIDGVLISSNTERIIVGTPESKTESKVAAGFFTQQVGMNICLNGSESPFLAVGKKTLESICLDYQESILGVKAAEIISASESRSFHRLDDKNKLNLVHKPNFEKALSITKPALEIYRKSKEKANNIAQHKLVRQRCSFMLQLGKKNDAVNELKELEKDLTQRGVNKSVIQEIETYQESI